MGLLGAISNVIRRNWPDICNSASFVSFYWVAEPCQHWCLGWMLPTRPYCFCPTRSSWPWTWRRKFLWVLALLTQALCNYLHLFDQGLVNFRTAVLLVLPGKLKAWRWSRCHSTDAANLQLKLQGGELPCAVALPPLPPQPRDLNIVRFLLRPTARPVDGAGAAGRELPGVWLGRLLRSRSYRTFWYFSLSTHTICKIVHYHDE